jgi:uncharacterized protein (TIGR03086 family)
MDEMVSLFLIGQREFGARVGEIADDQWSVPTVDTEWDVAALVDHLIDEGRWVGPLMSGQSLREAGEAVKAMGSPAADRAAAWQSAATSASDVLASADLDANVELSRGPTPARSYLGEMIFDLCVHSWDLGQAIGSARLLPDELVEPVYELVKSYGDLSALGDMFAPAVPVSDDAPTVNKLIGLTGRNPG